MCRVTVPQGDIIIKRIIAPGLAGIVVAIISFCLFYVLSPADSGKSNSDGSSIDLPSTDTTTPEETPPPTAQVEPDPYSQVDKLLSEMEFAAIAFNAPKDMNLEDSRQIQLVLSVEESVEKLKKSLTEEGEKTGAIIKVSDRMEARLSGYMFQITAITPEVQAISAGDRTEWVWEVHPKEQGHHRLHLTLTALLEIDGRTTPRAIRTFSEVVDVNVTATQKVEMFIRSNWKWLWATFLVPIVGWIWKRRENPPAHTS